MDVIPTGRALGAEITGIDLSKDVSASQRDFIFNVWIEHLVVLFRGQSLSFADLLRRHADQLQYARVDNSCTPVGGAMTDALDIEIYDPVVLDELVLTADLMIAANTTEHHLSQHAIDVALGLDHALALGA